MAGKKLDNLWMIHFIAGVTAAARSSSRSKFEAISSASIASGLRASKTTLNTCMAASRIKIFFVVCMAATDGATWSKAARISCLYGTPIANDRHLLYPVRTDA